MFFISHKVDDKYAVVDTDDGVIDLFTSTEIDTYRYKGFTILTYKEASVKFTDKMYRVSLSKLYKKLSKLSYDTELKDYLNRYAVYSILDILVTNNLVLNLDNLCRLFDYSQTGGYFVLVLGVSGNKTLICTIYDELAIDTVILDGNIKFGLYPSCSGWQINKLLSKVNSSSDVISDSCTYLLMYSDDYSSIHIVNHYDLDVAYCVSNPSRVQLC